MHDLLLADPARSWTLAKLSALVHLSPKQLGRVFADAYGLTPRAVNGQLDFRELTDAPNRHAIPGVQAKASATTPTSPIALAQERALLKIDPVEYPHLVANEALHLQGARGLRLPVAKHRVVTDRLGTEGL